MPTRKQRVTNKGDISLLGGGEQNDAAWRMPGHFDNLQANVAQLNGVALGKQPRRLARIGRLDAPHRSLFFDIRMRHSCVLAAQLVQGVSANGGTNSSDTANMIGVTVRANGTEQLHIGVFGSNVLNEALALPGGIDITA